MVVPLGLLLIMKTQNLMVSLVHTGFICLPSSSQAEVPGELDRNRTVRALCNRDNGTCIPKALSFPFIVDSLFLTCLRVVMSG